MPDRNPPQVPAGRSRILVVDDEPRIRAMLTRALALSGYSVEEASSGSQALELAARKSYDLMILDIQMPGMDGIQVMQRARQLSPELLVIILTGHGSLDSAIAAVKSDAVDYLLKPAGIHEIVAAVQHALQSRSDQVQRHRLLRLVDDAMVELHHMSASASASAAAEDGQFVSAGPFTLDRRTRVLLGQGDPPKRMELSENEAAVLEAFFRQPDSVLTCHDLARLAWNYDLMEEEARTLLRQYIFRLRQKIEAEPARPFWIRTVRGRGYLFATTGPGSAG